ncbi:PfkB family carbohydrate kinase [Pseudoalteromonas sp. MMG005]|uniref:PfkB family carbohydrate kinase n=1 Tax=Pseudoalteromonas sp. MMG005 TaxID=2822682 RepID=UPI001B3A0B79|nr:PfkB family carbohydrate kinase [Pseudoalteromonas sp. MMG005]MBQ4846322.1 adenylyltransferase/cytidyltransferase family protein [Pseudoalteromonas sp. MMG005]
MRTVLVQGNFDVLHPGHIRLLHFARECGHKLLVAVNSDSAMPFKSRVSEQHRLEVVQSLECVDDAFLTNKSATDIVHQYKPYAVVKGKEFESRDNPERKALNIYGGKLIFGSGEFESNAEQFIRKPNTLTFDYREAREYAKRHEIDIPKVHSTFAKIKTLNVLVIGEIIVDQYVQGTAIGLSQEDPTIVMTPNKTDIFLGGAAITAGHIKSIGAKSVHLLSVVGEDKMGEYVKSNIHKYNVNSCLFDDNSRPTPLKIRYRAGNKTLLRVNQVRQHKVAKDLQNDILNKVSNIINDMDLVVFSDFNYGVLPQWLVDNITNLCIKNNVKVVADSQTSSQVGDISRYKGMHLVTPTEREVRVALNNPDDGLVILAQKLATKSRAESIVITLSEQGIFIHQPTADLTSWESDRLPAINKHAVDPAGAGDCFLAASSLALTTDASPWLSYYLGSMASACQVNSLGNSPLELTMLEQVTIESLA